jgi:phosphatidylglycerophosphatase A
MRKLLATFFGIGFLPGPSGTYASAATAFLMGVAIYFGVPWWSIAAAALAAIIVGIIVGEWAWEDFNSKDPHEFVLDEVAGMLIAGLAAWVPAACAPWSGPGWRITIPIAFFWFRVTDILKPPPARQLEKLPRGWGIVMDDVAAGLMALALTLACNALWGYVFPQT